MPVMIRCKPRSTVRNDAGFVLIVVIWIAALFALITVAVVRVAQSHVRTSATLAQSARAELLAASGVALVALDLAETRNRPARRARFAADNSAMICDAGADGRLVIRVQDEAGRINLNLASERLLMALFIGLGTSRIAASGYTDAIIDFRDSDSDRRLAGAEKPEYLAAGRSFGPKNAPLDSLEELNEILGLDAEIVAAMLPHVTVHSGLAGLDPRFTTAQLTEFLARGLEDLPAASSRSLRSGRLPAEFAASSTQRVISTTVSATLTAGASFVREAVIELPADRNKLPAYLAWKRGNLTLDGLSIETGATLSSCW